MPNRIYYHDPYRTEFDAVVTGRSTLADRPAVTLDTTAFYPTSGGQPHDTGLLGEARVDRRRRVRGGRRSGTCWTVNSNPVPRCGASWTGAGASTTCSSTPASTSSRPRSTGSTMPARWASTSGAERVHGGLRDRTLAGGHRGRGGRGEPNRLGGPARGHPVRRRGRGGGAPAPQGARPRRRPARDRRRGLRPVRVRRDARRAHRGRRHHRRRVGGEAAGRHAPGVRVRRACAAVVPHTA